MPIKREPVDGAIWTFFERVGLDLDATRAAINEAHRAKGSELVALHDQAQREADKAEERLTRVRRDYQDGRLDADDWREQRQQLSGELDAAKAEAERDVTLREQLAERERSVDAESAVLREFAALRALVVGQAQERLREGLDAFRAALLRLFEHFTLITHTGTVEFTNVERSKPGEVMRHIKHDKLLLPGDRPRPSLMPHVREEAVERWTYERRVDRPALRKAALEMTDSASPAHTRDRPGATTPKARREGPSYAAAVAVSARPGRGRRLTRSRSKPAGNSRS